MVPFGISHKILNPYTAKYAFYWLLIFVCDLWYLWMFKSQALVRWSPGALRQEPWHAHVGLMGKWPWHRCISTGWGSSNELDLEWICPVGAEFWTLFQYSIRRLIIRSLKSSKPQDLYLELSDRSKIWQAPRQHCSWQISKQCDDLNHQSHGFETSPDLKIRHLIGYWMGPRSCRCPQDSWSPY